MKEYFLTIRKHQVKDYVSDNDLSNIIELLKSRLPCEVSDLVYEIDNKYNQLHSHLIVRSQKSIFYKKNSSINGFRLYWLLIDHNKKAVMSYIHKDSYNKYEQEQIILTNFYRHNYGFQDTGSRP